MDGLSALIPALRVNGLRPTGKVHIEEVFDACQRPPFGGVQTIKGSAMGVFAVRWPKSGQELSSPWRSCAPGLSTAVGRERI